MIPILSDILDFIYPPVCHVCGTRLAEHEKYICTGCIADLPRTLYHRRDGNPMEQRFAGLFPFQRASGHYFYSRDTHTATLIHDLKYRKFRGLARYLGQLMGEELYSTSFLSDSDIIVPIPMFFLKKALRGYNQTEEIALGLSAATGIPVVKALRAVRPHRSQTTLTGRQRRRNTEGIFRLDRPGEVRDKRIVLLDDVCTTGSTLISASRAILSAVPDAEITLLTVAVTF